MIRTLASTLCVCLLVACGNVRDARRPARIERDSAGIRIVEYSGGETLKAPIQLSEILRIGRLDGPDEYLFSDIVGGVLLDDGSFVVADRGASEIRRFSDSGDLLGRHGREGQGPGEYEYIRGVGRCSASGFTVFDISWRMNRYDSLATFLETRPMRLEDGSPPYLLACSPGGRFAVTNWDLGGPPSIGIFTARARLRTLRPDGKEEFDLGERIGSERFGTPTGSGPHPFGRSTRLAFDGEDLIVADGSFFGYERWSPSGKLEEIVRVGVPVPDAQALLAEYVENAIARSRETGDDDVQARLRSYRQWGIQLGELETAAYLRAMRVLDGRVLIQEQAADPDAARWFAFTEDDAPLGFLELPPTADLLDMSDSRILVVESGKFDTPEVVLYELDGRP